MSAVRPLESLLSTVTIRRAKPTDVERVTQFGIEGLKRYGLTRFVIDEDKVRNMARQVISGAGNFCMIATREDRIVGALSASTHPMMFFERHQCSVVQFMAIGPTAGLIMRRLFVEFLTWAHGRPLIKLISVELEAMPDPRMARFLKRLGFNEQIQTLAEVR